MAFLLKFFFSFHITFLYSLSELLYKYVADFAFFKTVLEGVYLWAGPRWLILHESRAVLLSLSICVQSLVGYHAKHNFSCQHIIPSPVWDAKVAVTKRVSSLFPPRCHHRVVTHHLTSRQLSITSPTVLVVIARQVTELRLGMFYLIRSGILLYFNNAG